MVQLAQVQVGSSNMDMTEFVAKHGDPSRPGYAAQHPNAGANRMARTGFLAPSENTPPDVVGITVAEDKQVFPRAEYAKSQGNLARQTNPGIIMGKGDTSADYKQAQRDAARAHQNVADLLEPKLYEIVAGEKVVRTGLDATYKKNLVASIDWYSKKAMDFIGESKEYGYINGQRPYVRFPPASSS